MFTNERVLIFWVDSPRQWVVGEEEKMLFVVMIFLLLPLHSSSGVSSGPGNRVWVQNSMFASSLFVYIVDGNESLVASGIMHGFFSERDSFLLPSDFSKQQHRKSYMMKFIGVSSRKSFTFIHSVWVQDSRCKQALSSTFPTILRKCCRSNRVGGYLWHASGELGAITYTPTNIYGKPFTHCQKQVCSLPSSVLPYTSQSLPHNSNLPLCEKFSASKQAFGVITTTINERSYISNTHYYIEAAGNFIVDDLTLCMEDEDLAFDMAQIDDSILLRRRVVKQQANKGLILMKPPLPSSETQHSNSMVFVYIAIGHEEEGSQETKWFYNYPKYIKYEVLGSNNKQIAIVHLCTWNLNPSHTRSSPKKRVFPRPQKEQFPGPDEGWKGEVTGSTNVIFWETEQDCSKFSAAKSKKLKNLRSKAFADYQD